MSCFEAALDYHSKNFSKGSHSEDEDVEVVLPIDPVSYGSTFTTGIVLASKGIYEYILSKT